MKKVAIISLGYLWFPCESGTSRFFQIAQHFVNRGYEVECITTSFQHFKKEPRDQELILKQGYPFEITFIEAPPYKKNVDIRRVLSNRKAAANLKQYLADHIQSYDVVYVAIPANNIAAMVTRICRQHQVPVIVDIEDLWPEAMSMVVKNASLRKLLFSSFERDAETAYANADGVIGTSEDYTDRAFKVRKRDIPAQTVYVGCNLEDFDAGAQKYQPEIEKKDGEFWVTYAGSISTSYDIKTLIDAGHELETEHVQIQILGTGSLKEELERYSQTMKNIHFWGFTAYPKMAAVLKQSDVVVNSFVKGAPQSIVNKVGDYLASGRPMINTLENPVFCGLVERNDVGTNIEPGITEPMARTIRSYQDDPKLCRRQGQKARKLAETEFDRKVSYPRIVDMADQLIEKTSKKREL